MTPQARGIVAMIDRQHRDARDYVTPDMFDALIHQYVLSAVLSQSLDSEWPNVLAFSQGLLSEIRRHYGIGL